MDLFTNSKRRRDFFTDALDRKQPCRVNIAVAFFTDADPVLRLQQAGFDIRLLVRLGFPTAPEALRKVMAVKERIQVRFVADSKFHPKLYLFEGQVAFVGSSNLTRSALTTNQEVNVALSIEDERYDSLLGLFAEYWTQSAVLESSVLADYESVLSKYARARRELDLMERDCDAISKARISNVSRDQKKSDVKAVYVEGYRAQYQEFLSHFEGLRRVYEGTGRRKSDRVPLRVEIDVFLCWVRDTYAKGDSYNEAPVLCGPELDRKVAEKIEEWVGVEYTWLHTMEENNYPGITNAFASRESMARLDMDGVVAALSFLNSFEERKRHFLGGLPTLKATFTRENQLSRVISSLTYLLFGKDDYVVRMGNCIYHPDYQLNQFGRSGIQELLGWVNDEEIPLCNSRTLKSMRWLGYDVVVIG